MHELGITQGIIDRAREAATGIGAAGVTDLFLTITPAADFTVDSIEMYFEMLIDGDGFFQGARLHWEHAPASATCLSCGRTFEAQEPMPVCPQCGQRQVRFDSAAPMLQLTDIGVAEEEERAAGDEGGGPG